MSTSLRIISASRRVVNPGLSALTSKWIARSPYSRTSTSRSDNQETNKPFPYMTYKDRSWETQGTFVAPQKSKAQAWSLLISLAVFLLYFLWLREENDIDEWLYKPFVGQSSEIEEGQLKAAVQKHEEKNLNTQALEEKQLNR